jgi:hypothetical protein
MFNPKFPTFRARIVTLAILFAVYRAVVLLSGRDPCNHGRHAIVAAVILTLMAGPGEPKKSEAEKYYLTGKGGQP